MNTILIMALLLLCILNLVQISLLKYIIKEYQGLKTSKGLLEKIMSGEMYDANSNPGNNGGSGSGDPQELKSKKITFYNPHRHDFIGFIRLLGCMKSSNFSYYIGPESPLEDGIYIPKEVLEDCHSDTDTKGIEHVNLTISSEDVQVVCFIDRNEERYIIDTIYFCLTKKHLKYMEEEKCNTLSDWIRRYRDRYKVLSDSIDLPDPEDK